MCGVEVGIPYFWRTFFICMSRFLIVLTIITSILLVVDIYGFFGIRQLTANLDPVWKRVVRWGWWVPTVISLVLVAILISKIDPNSTKREYKFFFLTIGFTFLFLLPKLTFLVFHFFDDIMHGIRWVFHRVKENPNSTPSERMTRIQFFNQVGLGASAIVFGSILYGITKGKYGFRIEQANLAFKDLPASFDGLKIVQISDAHLGSFLDNSFEEVQQAINMINDLQPDLILFTGDLVNDLADEAEPWVPYFQQLKARYGKYSILGNHDYAEYIYSGDSPNFVALRKANMVQLQDVHKRMGFRLLLNENVQVENNGESINLVGVENWGRTRFSKYGDIRKASAGIAPGSFNILLSHDPTHWEDHIMGKEPMHITLSGHTHGAQFGLESPMLHIKVSPSPFFGYKRWAGLYQEGEQYLYVNRGFGFLGFPGRVGMPPEITFITVNKA